MVSDDTEHMMMTACALAQHPDDPEEFQKNLQWRLRWWFLRLPGGIGLATGKALIKAWLGFSPAKCGVFSAGDGPAMRAPVVGVCLGNNPPVMKRYIKLSTELTHTDPRAFIGALAVAVAAHMACVSNTISLDDYFRELFSCLDDADEAAVSDFEQIIAQLRESLSAGESAESFAQKVGAKSGVSGYMYQTVPMVLFVWLRHQGNYGASIEAIVSCGGDTDTTAAVLGGICGAQNGKDAIPPEWLDNIVEYPFTKRYAERMAARLEENLEGKNFAAIPLLFGPAILFRNLIFIAIVLFHGLRRLLPPY